MVCARVGQVVFYLICTMSGAMSTWSVMLQGGHGCLEYVFCGGCIGSGSLARCGRYGSTSVVDGGEARVMTGGWSVRWGMVLY